jgi:hypothetical protein
LRRHETNKIWNTMAKDTIETVRKGVMLPPPSSKQRQKMLRAGEKTQATISAGLAGSQ